ncbi:hypothetical protein PHET_09051 [Paragonimus heterotremus]|uniref:Uncharacterized protein n=1 Tax=Paragonimus heterotremus TaxID=100268 RepID=A0A8J4T3P8_9TREM|nr:hypothetical protein PHET_09051 [Paragonimus heterotremus]
MTTCFSNPLSQKRAKVVGKLNIGGIFGLRATSSGFQDVCEQTPFTTIAPVSLSGPLSVGRSFNVCLRLADSQTFTHVDTHRSLNDHCRSGASELSAV